MENQITQHSSTEIKTIEGKFFKCYYAESTLTEPEVGYFEEGYSIGALTDFLANGVLRTNLAIFINDKLISDFDIVPTSTDVVKIIIVPSDPATMSIWAIAGIYALASAAGFAIGYYLFRPDTPDQDSNERLASIRGVKNRARKYEPFRAVFGKRIVTPDFISEPYTIRKGQDEYLKVLMSVGYGPLRIRDLKIGETPLSDYEHSVAIYDSYENKSIRSLVNIWNSDIVQTDFNITLKSGSTPSELVTNKIPINFTVGQNANKVIIDAMLPRGLTSGDEHRATCIDHSYINPVDLNIGGKFIPAGRRIKIAKVLTRNVGFNTKFTLRPNALIQMSDGSYRKCIGFNTNGRNPWDRTDGRGTNNTRNPYNRSYTFPSDAIIEDFQGNGYSMVYIDMEALHGVPRFMKSPSNDDFNYLDMGTWSRDDSIACWYHLDKSNRQQRFSIEYVPLHVLYGSAVSNTFSTSTYKTFPHETPNDAARVDEIYINNIKVEREVSESGWDKIIGGDKQINPSIGKTFRPAVIALEIKATDQLSGMLDNFNVEATSVVPSDWNADWRKWHTLNLVPSENPADMYRWLLQGPFTDTPFPNEKLDLADMLEWRNICAQASPPNISYASSNQWRISYEMVTQTTLQKALGKIAYTGRAEYSYNGKFGVVIRKPQDIPVQVFTPKNSWDFQANRVYPEVVDGIRYEFDNEDKTYQQDEDYFYDPRTAPDDYTGKFDAFTFEGVPNQKMAFRLARFNYYENALQRERYQLSTDAEGLVARRGSYVRIQHDIIDVGLGTGRVKEKGNGYIVIDETHDMKFDEYYFNDFVNEWNNTDITFEGSLDATFGLQFRYSDGFVEDQPVSGVYKGNGRYNINNAHMTKLNVGDLVVYGDLGKEYIDAIVIGMEYTEDLGAKVYLTNYDKRVFEYDENAEGDNPIPDFISQLTDRPEYLPPNAPVLTNVDNLAGIDIAKQQVSIAVGYSTQLTNDSVESFSFQFRDISMDSEDWEEDLDPAYDINNTQGGTWKFAGTLAADETAFILQGIERGYAYRIRARARGKGDLYSAYSQAVSVIVDVSIPPASVTPQGMSYTHSRDGITVKWDTVIDPDLLDYEIRTDTNVGNEVGLLGNSTSPRFNIGYVSATTTVYVYARTVYDVYSDVGATIDVDTFYIPPAISSLPQSDTRSGTFIKWSPIVSTANFPNEYLDYYEIRTNTNVNDATGLVTTLRETSFNVGYISSLDLPTYYIYAVSVAGYRNGVLTLNPINPTVNPVEDLVAVPIDNVAVVDWEAPTNIIYPISGYRVSERKPSRLQYESVGTFAATFINLAERQGGLYSYKVETIDFAGNISAERTVVVNLYNPTDFLLFYNGVLDTTLGTVTNGIIDLNEAGQSVVYMTPSPTKTIQAHIDEVGVASPTFTNKHNNVGAYFPQRTIASSASNYEQIFDMFNGDVGTDLFLRDNALELNFKVTNIDDTPAIVTGRVYWSTNQTFTIANSVTGDDKSVSAFIDSQFRYIKVEILVNAAANSNGKTFAVLEEMEIVVDVKQKTDQGKADVVGGVNGTEIFFNKDIDANTNTLVNRFLDVDAVTATIREAPVSVEGSFDRYTVYTMFEYLDPNGSGEIVRDRFKVFIQDTQTGAFVDGKISWVARGK